MQTILALPLWLTMAIVGAFIAAFLSDPRLLLPKETRYRHLLDLLRWFMIGSGGWVWFALLYTSLMYRPPAQQPPKPSAPISSPATSPTGEKK